jgi:hypothetical protein
MNHISGTTEKWRHTRMGNNKAYYSLHRVVAVYRLHKLHVSCVHSSTDSSRIPSLLVASIWTAGARECPLPHAIAKKSYNAENE